MSSDDFLMTSDDTAFLCFGYKAVLCRVLIVN